MFCHYSMFFLLIIGGYGAMSRLFLESMRNCHYYCPSSHSSDHSHYWNSQNSSLYTFLCTLYFFPIDIHHTSKCLNQLRKSLLFFFPHTQKLPHYDLSRFHFSVQPPARSERLWFWRRQMASNLSTLNLLFYIKIFKSDTLITSLTLSTHSNNTRIKANEFPVSV